MAQPPDNETTSATEPSSNGPDRDARELRALLDVLYEQRGLDFRDYAQSSLKRRVKRRIDEEGTMTIAGLCECVLRDRACLDRLVKALTIHTTAMFRDPEFFLTFRNELVPVLRTYPFLRFWVAGCSTGEEVYSLSIVLRETGLQDRCRIYATDINETILNRAKAGIFPLSAMQEYTRNYQKAGGAEVFAKYYTADNENVIFRNELRNNVIFGHHNLTGDASFNEFHGILCRNVMIYFNRNLQERAHKLFYESLVTLGYLGLGRSESLRFTSFETNYEPVSLPNRIYRKIR